MRTLVFCTSYAASEADWDKRQGLWIKALQRSELRFDQLLIVDDGSKVMPRWPHLTIVREAEAPRPEDVVCTAPILLYAFAKQLGRQSVFEFPGWYRSFAFGVLYGAAHGFEKIIHIESDAFLVSGRLQRHFNEFTSGWFAMWCEAYLFPEIAIQAAAGDEIPAMVRFVREPYSQLVGRIHEYLIPFTHIERFFVGNRYGEMIGHVPRQADFSTQTHLGQPDGFYWWIPRDGADSRRQVSKLRAPFPVDILEGSWSGPEEGMSWMLDFDSSLYLPPVDAAAEHELELDLAPCLYMDRKQQRLYVLVNERLVNAVTLFRAATILCHLPAGLLHGDRANHVRFLHPDGFAPSEVGDHAEHRKLSIALAGCALHERSRPSPSL